MRSTMNRRCFILRAVSLAGGLLLSSHIRAGRHKGETVIEKITRSEPEWRETLTPEQFYILREEGTERAHSSPLNEEYRQGIFVCAGCEFELFTSEMKFDSGTGWPSFTTAIEGHVETKTDFKLIYPRKEYHCARCGGHQGHVFKDGPDPTGQRWCNNGIALKFRPAG